MKLINYRCEVCGLEEEFYLGDSEAKSAPEAIKCACGAEAKQFNFKNNSQTWQFLDKR